MSTRILIVDDESAARERISRYLTQMDSSFILDHAANGFEALQKMKLQQPDILFLDIQMPEMNGFEMLQNLEKKPFQIIFQTAYEQFALKAFEESACDYLLKPFEKERLEKAVNKAIKSLGHANAQATVKNVLQKTNPFLQKIAIKQGNKSFQIDVSDVICFTSKDHYTCVYTVDKEYVIDLSLSYLEENLDPVKYFRCHRSHTIALDHIRSLNLGPRMKAVCRNGLEVDVSRHNRAVMKERFHKTAPLKS